jgi:opacity protein-like surface antigen
MRKIFLFLVFVITLSSAYSQGLRLGVCLDPQISWMSPDTKNVKKDGSRLGINFGLIAENYFAKNYAIATGISITTSGGKLQYNESGRQLEARDYTYNLDSTSVVTYKIQYITVPLAIKLKTNRIGYFSYYANLGLTTQVRIKARGDASRVQDPVSSIPDTNISIEDVNINDEVSLFNMGYHFGGGAEYSLGENATILLGVQYTNGFLSVTKNKDDVVNLSNFSLKLGFLF